MWLVDTYWTAQFCNTPKSESLGYREGKFHDVSCVCVGGEKGVKAVCYCHLGGDWRTAVKQLPRVRRCGVGGNRRAPQMHEFAPSCCLFFPMASHQSSGCSRGAVSNRGQTRALLLLPHDSPTCGICAVLSGHSLSSHVPRVLFISALVLCHLSPGKAYLLSKSCLFPRLPMTIPFPYSFFSSFKFWVSEKKSSWFSNCPLTSLLSLASFSPSL